MNTKRQHIGITWGLASALWLLCLFGAMAQEGPVIRSAVDTAAIRIGEQIRFTVEVEADSAANVIFPEGQTFSPLETVEALPTDTTREDHRMRLLKTYALTQFDSGYFLLPSQRIEVDGRGYFTDSLFVSVATIPVDTVTQKMYDIKPLEDVEASSWGWLRILGWVVLALLFAGGLFYWFFWRRKPLSESEQEALLPPFERALHQLRQLEDSRYLIQDEFKAYYTELTNIVRLYLEDEIHVSALESTTSELITKLEMLRDAGQLNLDPETLSQFRTILETADLVKFAKSKPATSRAEEDRKAVELIVVKTHDAIPPPTEEELMEQEAYKEAQRALQRRKRIRLAAAAAGILLLVGSGASVAYFGVDRVRESVFGTPTKSLLEGEWISSSYGYPPILVETPQVLLRKEITIPPEMRASIADMHIFGYDNPGARLSVMVSSTVLTDPEAEPDIEGSIEAVLARFEQSGARNIITKQDSFTTASGVEGIKVYGSARFAVPDSGDSLDGAYQILLFGGKGFLQQVVLSWEEGDAYAEAIVQRILQTLDVKTTV
ncbi:hypothetical protein [Robiginitalea sediminis]|uniref:hypothetical protein n=1 Tax=Robiginitalea sediminis TaxID=1982593 RepID=UPI001E61BACB|nr:hypothetical protein [Robiginitalea sediminis]